MSGDLGSAFAGRTHPEKSDDARDVIPFAGALFDALPDPVFALDRRLRVLYLNPASRALVLGQGIDPAALLGRSLYDAYPWLRERGVHESIARAFADRRSTHERDYTTADGRHFEMHFVPVGNAVFAISREQTPAYLVARAHQRTVRLQEVTAALSNAATSVAVARIVVDAGRAIFGAPAGSMSVLDESRGEVVMIHSEGHTSPSLEAWRSVPIDARLPTAETVRTGRVVGYSTLREREERFDPPHPHFPSGVAVPLRVDDRVIGSWGLSFAEPRQLEPDDVDFLLALAHQAAQAIERARLHEAERKARQRSTFLAAASEALASSLDFDATLTAVAELAVPQLADWCAVHLRERGGDIRLVTVAHADAARVEWARALHERHPAQIGQSTGIGAVIRTGEALYLPQMTDEAIEELKPPPTVPTLLRDVGLRGLICVPLRARDVTIGAISFAVTRESGRHYSPDDFALAREVARRAATAVDHAQLYHEAVEANAAKANFLAVVSHELRTPLTAVIGYTELLAEEIAGPVTPMQREQLTRIRASSTHLLTLIEEILAFARLEAGRETVHAAPTDLREVVRSAAVLVEPLVERKGLQLVVRTPERPVILTTDSAKVRQILLNLLTNAVKFTEAGEIRLTLERSETGTGARLVVTDTGVGISSEHQQAIFDPFWQVEQPTTRRAGGTGLGLSVVRQLTELLGGQLSVESTPGAGSTFVVTLA